MLMKVVVVDVYSASNGNELMSCFKNGFSARLDINLLGSVESIIGLKISRSRVFIKVDQTHYLSRILQYFGLQKAMVYAYSPI